MFFYYLWEMIDDMTSNSELTIFEELNIRPTSVRMVVYRAILKYPDTFSAQDLEDELNWMERSSIFRALTLFNEKGLIHSVDDGGGIKRYCLCREIGSCDSCKMHCHFHCQICGKTLCLKDLYISKMELPSGFVTKKISCVISGSCDNCTK